MTHSTSSTPSHDRCAPFALPLPVLLLALAGAGACEQATRPADGAERHRVIETDAAPAAIGPYSQAILAGSTLYLAGQIALDPETGDMVDGGIEPETRQVMENLGAVLRAADFGFEDVVQSHVFLADLDEFAAMNDVYSEYFPRAPPARATVQVARLPRDARVEIVFTAVRSRVTLVPTEESEVVHAALGATAGAIGAALCAEAAALEAVGGPPPSRLQAPDRAR
jgi:2-iminobutanoate/2-iminopropanoate deaminase